MAMKISGVEAKMNKAAESIHKSGGEVRKGPAASKGGSEVGNETKANMKGALGDAVSHLHSQHPEAYDDLGPHHSSKR